MLSNASLLLLHVSREAFFFISACMLTYAYAGLNLGPDPAPAGRGGIFLCTSGTTGTPKGILLREDQLMHVAGSAAAHHRLTPADRGYCCLPLFHINAEVVGLLATLAAGACLVVDRTFSRRGFWELIEARQITWINAVPAIITILAMDPLVATRAGPLRPFGFGAAGPLGAATVRGLVRHSGGGDLRDDRGGQHDHRQPAGRAAQGRLRPARRYRGPGDQPGRGSPRPCPPGAIGRVQIRGPGVITEYAEGRPADAIDADGWLETGDLGHLDRDGYLFLAGRSDDVINRGGEKIYPREIEEFLLTQPGVRSAVVVAARDEVLGQRPVAYVVPAADPGGPGPASGPAAGLGGPDLAELADALRAACSAALPRPKRPTEFCLVPELPVGATGKVSRRRLRELACAAG